MGKRDSDEPAGGRSRRIRPCFHRSAVVARSADAGVTFDGRSCCPPRDTDRIPEAIVATRKERFLKQQNRGIRRRKRYKWVGWYWRETEPGEPGYPHWVRNGRKWQIPLIGLQAALDLKAKSTTFGPLLGGAPPGAVATTIPAERRKPAVPILSGFYMDGIRALSHHLENALHGYHRRRVRIYGRKQPRMDGWTRRLWGNAVFFMNNGYYRDSDPLGRHPNETDVDNGAPPDPDPQWPGIPE